MPEQIKYKYEYDKLATELRREMHTLYNVVDIGHPKGPMSGRDPIDRFELALYYKFDREIMIVENRDTDKQHKMLQEFKDSLCGGKKE